MEAVAALRGERQHVAETVVAEKRDPVCGVRIRLRGGADVVVVVPAEVFPGAGAAIDDFESVGELTDSEQPEINIEIAISEKQNAWIVLESIINKPQQYE